MLTFSLFSISLQGYEDILRHRSDKEVNNRPVQVVRNGKRVEVLSKDIRVSLWSGFYLSVTYFYIYED